MRNKIIPVLKKMFIDGSVKELYEPFKIKGYYNTDLFKLYKIDDKFILYDEIEDYYKNNPVEYNWSEINKWAMSNAGKIKYKFTKYPGDERVMAVRHENATSILFSFEHMSSLAYNKKLLVCPLFEDFVLFMHKDSINDFMDFVKIIKALNYTILQKHGMTKYVTDTVFVFDPLHKSYNNLNTLDEFGLNFTVVSINTMDKNTVNEQIKRQAINVLYNELRECSPEEVYEILSDEKIYNDMLDDVQKDIKRAIDDGKEYRRRE